LVLLPALILGAAWDQIGMRLAQGESLYYGGLANFYAPSVALRSTVSALFGNLSFLQGIVSPVFGSNDPLWSLSYEFWYYILFPLLMLGFIAWKGFRVRLLYIALALALVVFVGPRISLYFLIWAAGAVVGRLRVRRPSAPRETQTQRPETAGQSGAPEDVQDENARSERWMPGLAFAGGLLFVAALGWNRVRPIGSEALSDGTIGACFAIWLFTLIHGAGGGVSALYSRLAKTLSGFSYTLYLTHFPALLLLRALLNPQGNWMPDALHFVYAMVIAAAILGYAYFLAECTEAQTAVIRRRILQPWTPRARQVL
jgi:peptidoglycan/LPS O-acetylase OafA/YrhL